MKNPYYFKGANPTVDMLLLNPSNEVLLIQRSDNSPAHPGRWALPGGFIDTTSKKNEEFQSGKETPAQACIRELKEETNIDINESQIKFFAIFEGKNRDPRDNVVSWSKSHAFFCKLNEDQFNVIKDTIEAKDDAQNYQWISKDLLWKPNIAFDHKSIIESGFDRFQEEIKPPYVFKR
jgi:8-oxo-dGTP diphosphatase